ncbi:MAG TPA: hypothetical protein VL461_13585 [Dictyobacter sp.]|jgi:hypothetical protein|nr:hypothetical protein [Dictyobacter sp.]
MKTKKEPCAWCCVEKNIPLKEEESYGICTEHGQALRQQQKDRRQAKKEVRGK